MEHGRRCQTQINQNKAESIAITTKQNEQHNEEADDSRAIHSNHNSEREKRKNPSHYFQLAYRELFINASAVEQSKSSTKRKIRTWITGIKWFETTSHVRATYVAYS